MATSIIKKPDDSKNDAIKQEPRKMMSKKEVLKNLIMVSIGYMLLNSPYMGLSYLQSTLNNKENIGVLSLGVVFGFHLCTSLYIPRLVSAKFGLKSGIVIGQLTYLPYIAANLYPSVWTLLPTAALVGIGNGTLWISMSAYINKLSYIYADEDAEISKSITTKFFGMFYLALNCSQLFGNLISFVLFQPVGLNSTDPHFQISRHTLTESFRNTNITCGAGFCGRIDKVLELPSQETLFWLIGVYLALGILAIVVTSMFVDALKSASSGVDENLCFKLAAAFKHAVKIDQILLVVINVYTTFQAGFMIGEFTQAFVGCAWGIENVGLVIICFAAVSAIMCVTQSCLSKYIPRDIIIAFAAINNIAVCTVLLHWNPSKGHPSIMFIIAGCWSVSDAIWRTQMTAFYGVLFRDEDEAAFANFRIWEAFGFMLSFLTSSHFCTSSKIYMQIAMVSVGYAGYLSVAFRSSIPRNTLVITKQ